MLSLGTNIARGFSCLQNFAKQSVVVHVIFGSRNIGGVLDLDAKLVWKIFVCYSFLGWRLRAACNAISVCDASHAFLQLYKCRNTVGDASHAIYFVNLRWVTLVMLFIL